MILWMVKLLGSIRRAVAGRRYPGQLAWAVSFGLLLGVVPHGNLLAIAILIVVLSLRLNHAMAGLTAIGASFLATRLDPYSHQVGEWVLTHPELQASATAAWQLPLVPWTDLNNTVVMGSFLIGVASLVPVFLITYPVFRLCAPRSERETQSPGTVSQNPEREAESTKQAEPADARKPKESVHQIVLVDPNHQTIAAPHSRPRPVPQTKTEDVDFVEVEPSSDDAPMMAIETRIDVIRMQDHREANPNQPSSNAKASEDPAQPMDEALNYLLRQLRDSQQRKAA
jgi:uncharacterized protein (TIGR03546 family)